MFVVGVGSCLLAADGGAYLVAAGGASLIRR